MDFDQAEALEGLKRARGVFEHGRQVVASIGQRMQSLDPRRMTTQEVADIFREACGVLASIADSTGNVIDFIDAFLPELEANDDESWL